MNSENSAPTESAASTTTTEASATTEGGSSDGGSFDFSGWDGDRGNLPEQHHAVYDAMQQASTQRASEETNTKLREYLKNQIYTQNQQKSAVPEHRTNDDGSPLTREQAMTMFREEESSRKQRDTVDKFRTSLLDVVSKPTKYGEATVAFATETDVDSFKKFVTERLNGGLTAQDMLLLYKQKDVFRQLGDSAVKGFERKLKNNRPSDVIGNNVETRSSNIPGDSSGKRSRPGKAPRTAELLQANNPELYSAILNGKADLF
jgi:hypothetical protein